MPERAVLRSQESIRDRRGAIDRVQSRPSPWTQGHEAPERSHRFRPVLISAIQSRA
jgi:hypothetical protein